MNVLEATELNRKIRAILKTLDVAWKDGGHMITVSNKICDLVAPEIERHKTNDRTTLEAIRQLVSDD